MLMSNIKVEKSLPLART